MLSRFRGGPAPAPETVTVRWLLGGQLLMFCGIAAIFPVAPLYVRDHGGGPVAAAFFIAGALIATALVQVPAGHVVDRIGRRRVLLGSRIVYALLGIAIFALDAAPLWVLGALRTAMGLASGAYIPALLATLTDITPPGRRAERFSQLQAAELAGLLIGPAIGGVVALWRSSAIFLASGIGVGLGVLAQTNVPETGRVHPRTVDGESEAPPLPAGWWRRRGLLVPAVGLAAIGTAFAMYDVVWPQFLAARGASTVLIGLSISLFALPMLLLATPGGRLADRSDRRLVIGVCFLIVASCCATYPLLRSIPAILAVGIVEAIAFVMCEPALYATIGDSAPAEARGRSMGIGGTAQLGGSAFGAAALGSLYGVREGLPFWAASLVLVIAAAGCAATLPSGRTGRAPLLMMVPRSASGAEAADLGVRRLDDGDHARGPDVDGTTLGGKLDEVDGVLADGNRGDGVLNADRHEDIAAVHQAE